MRRIREQIANVENGLTPVGKPRVQLDLTSINGNSFSIMGAVSKALRRAGFTTEERKIYFDESTTSGSYDSLLCVAMDWTQP